MPDIELPDHLVEKLYEFPYGPAGRAAQVAFDRAVNAALDAEHWPRGPRGEIDVPTQHFFVNIWDKYGSLRGHVGPIADNDTAQRVAQSWRKAGYSALHTGRALGKALTNDHAS